MKIDLLQQTGARNTAGGIGIIFALWMATPVNVSVPFIVIVRTSGDALSPMKG